MAKPVYYYGVHAVKALLLHRPQGALALFVQEDSHEDIVNLAKQVGVSVQVTHKNKLGELVGNAQHQGVVVQARPLSMSDESFLEEICLKDNVLLLILDQVTDVHNLGACLRTASVMGADAVIVPKHQSVSLTPTVAKIAVGAAEVTPVVAVNNLARALDNIKTKGVFVFGTALNDNAQPLYDCDFTGKVAIVMGSEGSGIRRLTQENCDTLVYIPMSDNPYRPQSLNVGVATGMVLYEVMRSRKDAALKHQ